MVVFDLDDTLYEELEYVRSGFKAVAGHLQRLGHRVASSRLGELHERGDRNPFLTVLQELGSPLTVNDLVKVYRNHNPDLELAAPVRRLLASWSRGGRTLGLLTDGRSDTQRRKIAALGLETVFDEIAVSEELGSEKPAEANYRHFETRFPGRPFAYVGDNLAKDFVTPNRLCWTTVGLIDRGNNIHPQDFESANSDHLPQHLVRRIA